VKPRRRGLSDWRKQHDAAHDALDKGERIVEGRPVWDVLDEALHAMTGDGPANGPSRRRVARQFGQSANADRDERSASTLSEIEADKIFEAARPHLKKRTAWTALAVRISLELKQEITPNRLRMICRQARRAIRLPTTSPA
jgi:hypothetical protein